jgi:hypothetical protein
MATFGVMKTRIISCATLGMALYASVGFLAVFHLARMEVRNDVQARLQGITEESRLMIFHFTSDEWNQRCPDQLEFVLNGRMYDVISVSTILGKVQVKAYADIEESDLVAELSQLLDNDESKEKPARGTILAQIFGEKLFSNFTKLNYSFPGSIWLVSPILSAESFLFSAEIFSPPDRFIA